MKLITTLDGTEAAFWWACPYCGWMQEDSVHPQLGPFVTLLCSECGEQVIDADLQPEYQTAWENAIKAAELLE